MSEGDVRVQLARYREEMGGARSRPRALLGRRLGAADALAWGASITHGLDLERVYHDGCLRSEDRRAALEAFAHKKKPQFSGR